MNLQSIREIIIMAGDYEITSPTCYCEEFSLERRVEHSYSISSTIPSIIDMGETIISIRLRAFGLNVNSISSFEPIKIRNKKVKDCIIPELFAAIRVKTKEEIPIQTGGVVKDDESNR